MTDPTTNRKRTKTLSAESNNLPRTNHSSILPPDVLYQIFLFAFAYSPAHFPQIAAHVCQKWRECALDASLLWTKVVFARRTFDREEALIQRSRDAPLDIEITPKPFEKSAVPRMRAVMSLIRPHANRLRSLKIHPGLSNKTFIVLADALRDLDAPELENFVVAQTQWISRSRWRFRPFLLHGTPKLRELTMKKVPWDMGSMVFQGLKKIVLDNNYVGSPPMGAKEIYRLLKGSPNLEEFVLWARADYSTEPPVELDEEDTEHSKLSKLIVESSREVDTLLRKVKVPALTLFAARYRMSPRMFGVVCGFNNLSLLKDVTLVSDADPEQQKYAADLPTMLASLQCLAQLRFENFKFTEERQLRCLSTICPKLQDLSMMKCEGEGLTSGALREVVEKRIESRGEMQVLNSLWVVPCTADRGDYEWLHANVGRLYLVE